MMSATHFFGDIDVICDIGGQDIKVLFMQNGDIKNFRLSNQCSAGNGMLLQAMADQFGVPVTNYADVAFEAKLSPKFTYGCAVFLDSDRVNFQKEGYSKEELLAGPGAGAAEERLAVRGADPAHGGAGRASSCCRAARSTTWRRSRRRSTTSRRACPDAEVYVHPHTGEAGAIGAAIETLRVVKRRGLLDVHRHRQRDQPRVHVEERRRRRAATSARTCARARSSTPRRPTAARRATSPASAARRAPSSRKRRCSRSPRSARS